MRWIPYILAPLFYLCVALLGRTFTDQGVATWYPTLSKPTFTPSGTFIGVAWSVIYVLSAISLIVFVNKARGQARFWPIIGLYIINGAVNVLWSYIFFHRQMLSLAVVDAALIWITVALLVYFTWDRARLASLLLTPYLAWVSFAVFLSYAIWRLNI